MKYNVITDLVLLNVNGGQFSNEAPVQEQEVRYYIPVAAHKAIADFIAKSMAQYRSLKSAGDAASFSLPNELFTTYELPVESDGSSKFVTLPGKPQAWFTGANPIKLIQNKERTYTVPFLSPSLRSAIRGRSAWVEYSSQNRIYLFGVPTGCNLLVTAALEIQPLLSNDSTSEIAIPSSMQDDIVKICIDHFRGQIGTPGDLLSDNNQVNEQ